MSKIIAIALSGGIDSATLIQAVQRTANTTGRTIIGVYVDYGSRHRAKELDASESLCAYYGIAFVILHVNLGHDNSNLLRHDSNRDDPAEKWIVPGRNAIIASMLAGYVQAKGGGEVWMGMHRTDAPDFPDCGPSFIRNLQGVVRWSSNGTVTLHTPFSDLGMTKWQICKLALENAVPLPLTWTCYVGGSMPCGVCPSCKTKSAAMEKALKALKLPLELQDAGIEQHPNDSGLQLPPEDVHDCE